MRLLLSGVALALLSGCASFDLPPPQRIAPPTGNALSDAFNNVKLLQDDYVVEYGRLSGEANFYNGISITAAVATLGFAAFDAHQDNVLAAALVSGITDKAAGQLKPGTRAGVYYRAIKSLTCIYDNGQSVLNYAQASGPPLSIEGLLHGAGLGQASYEQMATALWELRSRAADIEIPSKELVAAIGEATVAEAALSRGADAAAKLHTTITQASSLVAGVVEKQPLPSLSALVGAITKVEYKKPDTAAGGSSGPAGGVKQMNFADGDSFLQFKSQQDEDSRMIAHAIGLIVRRVAATHPEEAEAAAKRVTACAVAFGASDGNQGAG